MMRTIVGLANAVYATRVGRTPVRMAAARPRMLAVRIGNAPITTARIVAAKIANRRQAWSLKPSGGGTSQMATATARVTHRAILPRVRKVVRPDFPPEPASASLASECGGVEDLIDLQVGQDVLAADELDDPLSGLHGLRGELGGALVPYDRVER